MEALPRDTPPEVWERQFAVWRAMTPAQKLALVGQMRQTVLHLARVGIRMRHPKAEEREVFLRLAEITLGPVLARRVYSEIVWPE